MQQLKFFSKPYIFSNIQMGFIRTVTDCSGRNKIKNDPNSQQEVGQHNVRLNEESETNYELSIQSNYQAPFSNRACPLQTREKMTNKNTSN